MSPPASGDSRFALPIWQQLLGDDAEMQALCASAALADASSVASVSRLRQGGKWPAELVAAALALAAARHKAVAKFGTLAERLACDATGVEMASSLASAQHKARRVVARLGRGSTVIDLCCGIGGDSIGLVLAGLVVTAVDRDPSRAWMTGRNVRTLGRAESTAISADVMDQSLPRTEAFVLDPSRRAEGKIAGRSWRLVDCEPGPDAITAIIGDRRDGAVKLGPGIDHAEALSLVPAGIPAEVEYLSENGRATQCVLWTGRLADTEAAADSPRTRATLLRADAPASSDAASDSPPTLSGTPSASLPSAGGADGVQWLLQCDVSIERARLLHEVCSAHGFVDLHPGLGVLCTFDAAPPPPSPLFERFRVLHAGAWGSRRIQAVLAEHDAGIVEVKTRGRAVEPDALQIELRGRGSAALTVFVLRLGRPLWGFVTRRER